MGVRFLPLEDGSKAILSLRDDSTSVLIGEDCVSSYDLAGRPYVLVREGSTFRYGLDGRLVRRGPDPHALAPPEIAAVVESARSDVVRVLRALPAPDQAGNLDAPAGGHDAVHCWSGGESPESADEAKARLERITRWSAAALLRDAECFRRLYRPLGILPPDQYLALLLQATEGCSWNRCTFCALYRDVPFRAKTPDEFCAHLVAVREHMGESLALRRSVFLGDANALCAAPDRVVAWLESVHVAFPSAPIASFVDAWTGHRQEHELWKTCASLGLKRVYVGLETGDPDLLSWLQKPGTAEDAVQLVQALHESGIAVGVIVMLGVGGERYFDQHVRETATVLRRMHLQSTDLLYLSPFVLQTGVEYARQATTPDLQALAAERCEDQRQSLMTALAPRPGVPRVAPYDIRGFAY